MLLRAVKWMLLVAFLAGCSPVAAAPMPTLTSPRTPALLPTQPTILTPTATFTITAVPQPTQTSAPAALHPSPAPSPTSFASGPDSYPPGVNPLTGLLVSDSSLLKLPPAMLSVSNSPVAARPQMGLSSAAWVFEIWIGEGTTRFFSVFYGEYPTQSLNGEEPAVGPIRSGRLPYEPLRKLYNGFVMMAFASKWVLPNLDYYTNVINENLLTDINGAHVHTSQLRQLAVEYQKKLGEPRLSGLRFDPAAPPGGKPAPSIFMPWSYYSQVWWHYDDKKGAYLRSQDREDGKTFVQAADRLTGQPLSFQNVIVLFADHTAYRPELIDINFMYIKKFPALVFRDGQIYPVYWTTLSDTYERKTGRLRPIRFVDSQGQPFPLKPGHTWVAVMTPGSPYYETIDTQNYGYMATKTAPGSGIWVVRYAVPEPQGFTPPAP